MTDIELKQFKGGSLGRTTLIKSTSLELLVRKSVSQSIDREYGLVRWHSQFKRLQKYSFLFPNLFPKIRRVGVLEGNYFMDLEYLLGYITAKDILSSNVLSDIEVETIATNIFLAATRMHDFLRLNTYPGSINLYFNEECLQKFNDALVDNRFRKFTENHDVIYNGVTYPSLRASLDSLRRLTEDLSPSFECLTHGNLTLENIMIHPKSLDVRFLDPYDENIVDCRESDFSQIRQCSRLYYGLLLDSIVKISGNALEVDLVVPKNFPIFEEKFNSLLKTNLVAYSEKLEDFFTISQFLRMLPFKVKSGDTDLAILFYSLACKLIEEFRVKYDN